MSRRPDPITTEPHADPPAGASSTRDVASARLPAWAPPWLTQRRIAWGLVWLMALAFTIFVGYHAVYRHLEFHTDAFDLGNMDQAVWNTLHGHPFRFTNRGNDDFGPPTRLSIHVEPIILPLSLLYLIHAGPETLLVTQTVALALGAFPLFALSLRRAPKLPFVGVGLVFAYLLNPFTISEALWDFHPVTLATPLLLAALWALDARRYRWFLAAAILAIATKEDVGLSVAIVALLLAVKRPEKRRFGVLLAVGALLWVAICFKVILPHYNIGVPGGNNYWYRYAWLGRTPTDAVINVLTRPWIVWRHLVVPGRMGYLAIMLRTAGALGLLAPALLLAALPDLAVNLLSTHTEQYSGFFQYNAIILPYLLGAAVYGVAALAAARQRAEAQPDQGRLGVSARVVQERVRSLWADGWRGALGGLAACGRAVAALWSTLLERIPTPMRYLQPLLFVWLVVFSLWNISTVGRIPPFWAAGNPPSPALSARMAAVSALLAKIPADAPVCATDTLDPHLSDRYALYLAPDPQCYQATYVAMDLPNAIGNVRAADAKMLKRMQASGHYTIIGETHGVIVLRRDGQSLAP
ncbi:MAG TPA: DUF2079 domain-containing protein [Ktedonobacterales bacterium]|nr:DUF2079 domain-containing protein [Ktedonobacterales bacterium]